MVSPFHILLAEDDFLLRHMLTEVLSLMGYLVTPVSNGREALTLLQTHPATPDLIITDLWMPEMDGNRLWQAVRTDLQHPAIPFIFISGTTLPADIATAIDRGRTMFIAKPFYIDSLMLMMQTLLSQPASQG